MYIPPTLERLGDARDVVLGVADAGFDLDTTAFTPEMEGAPEYPFPDQL